MINIIPAILAKTEDEFRSRLSLVWGLVNRVQLDIIDGVFADEKTVLPEVLTKVDTAVNFDAHLMVKKPEFWVERCAQSGFERVFGQIEMLDNPVAFVADAQALGLGVGLAYDIDTELSGLDKIIDDLDGVLLMSVKAGASGREFDSRVLSKISEVRKMSKRVSIIIDGGLNEINIKKCLVAEWEEEIAENELDRNVASMEFVVGNHLFSADNIEDELVKMRKMEIHGKFI